MSNAQTEPNDPIDDLSDVEETGEGSVVALVDAFPTIPSTATSGDAVAKIYDFQASVKAGYPVAVSNFVDETTNALADGINDGIVPPGVAGQFWFWLAYNAGVTLIPAATAYAFVKGYILQWLADLGIKTEPFGSSPAPAPLPSPTEGQKTVTGSSQDKGKVTVSGGTAEGTSGAQVSAALGVVFVDAMRVLADVTDAMLPGMAPGQVPQALSQLNAAVNALENQMAQVRAGVWPRGYQAALGALNGGLQALHGLEQEVGILANQMAEKADSALESDIKAAEKQIGDNTAAINTINTMSIPELGAALGTLAGTVGVLQGQVDNQIAPELDATKAEAAATAAELSGTDKECLDQLCEALNAATNPPGSQPAGSSPFSLLKSLLTKGAEILALMTLADGILGILDMQLAVSGVVSDTTTITRWAEQSAAVITADLTWGGGLNLS